MQPRVQQYLLDIVSSCREIQAFIDGDADLILNDRRTALAIERLLLIIGEALTRIRDTDPERLASISDWPSIIGMRNAIVHGYDTLVASRLRDSVRDEVPALLAEVESILGERR